MDDLPAWMKEDNAQAPLPKWMQEQGATHPGEQAPRAVKKETQQPSRPVTPTPEPSKLKQLGGYLLKELPGPDYLSTKLGQVGEAGKSGVEAMLTPTGKLDPVNLIPNRKELINDANAALFEGGLLGGPEGTAGLKATEKSVVVPSARALGEKAVSDALAQSASIPLARRLAENEEPVASVTLARMLAKDEVTPTPNGGLPKGNLSSASPINLSSRTAPSSAGAASTPIGQLAEHNIAAFDAANKAPGMRQQLKDAVSYSRKYFDDSDKAKAIIQKNLGREQRVGAQAVAAMQRFKSFVGEASIDEQIDLLKWLQDPQSKLSKGLQLNPEAQDFVNTFHDWMQTYQKKLQALPQTDQMSFRQNYVSQLWRQPKGAMKYINEYGAKQGSSYFTKARVFDDYEAGIRAGFAPVTTNPVEIFSRYIENASKKIAGWEAKNEAFTNGMMVYRSPQTGNIPVGWVPAKSIEPIFGQQAFAPPGFAKIFDNFASQPKEINIPGTQIDVLSAAQKAAATSTAFKLSVSGFHPALETMEGLFSGMANGITKLKNGRPIAGLADVITAPMKPINALSGFVPGIRSYARGRQLQQAYLDGNWGTPEMQRIVRGLTDANWDPMREGGLADEYRMSSMPGFIKGWTKGIPATAGGPLKMGLRAFETTMEPTFQYYVPWLKNQAMYDSMKTALDANPGMTDEEFAAYGRKIVSNIDARFGEINKNNIFLDATSKQMVQTALISWSFTLGQARQALGFAWDAARVPDKVYSKMKGTLPSTEEIWTDRMSYAIAIGLGTAFVNSIYQYIKTGKPPESGEDLIKPQTGGIDPATKQPERGTLPNFANSYMNIWNNGLLDELYNKTNPLWQNLYSVATNKDFAGHLIRDPNDTVPKQLEQIGQYAYQNALPISGSLLGIPGAVNNVKAGTHINSLERFFGVRAAGMRDTDPTKFKQIISYKNAEAWYEKRKMDVNQKRYANGLGPLKISHRDKAHLIEMYMKNPQSDPLQKYGGTQ